MRPVRVPGVRVFRRHGGRLAALPAGAGRTSRHTRRPLQRPALPGAASPQAPSRLFSLAAHRHSHGQPPGAAAAAKWNGDCLGAVPGAGNRGGAARPRRAHKQPDSARDARQHGERESFPTRSRLPTEPTPKSKVFADGHQPATLDAATDGRTTGTRPARPEQLRRFLPATAGLSTG